VPEYFSYYGVGGTTSVYSLKVEEDQSSTTMIWVQKGDMDSLNFIGFGWHVSFILFIYKKKLKKKLFVYMICQFDIVHILIDLRYFHIYIRMMQLTCLQYGR
jgi:hypothetical protein